MPDNKIVPAHVIRGYLWEILQEYAGMKKVNNLIPIVPFQDEPDLADSGKSYLIYGYADQSVEKSTVFRRGVFSVRIEASDINEATKIANITSRAFEDRDVATEAVNHWSGTAANGAFVGIRFTDIVTTFSEAGDPAESEGGPVSRLVSISYECILGDGPPLLDSYTSGLWSPNPNTP